MGLLGSSAEEGAAEDPASSRNPDFWRDMFNIVVGIVWQVALVALPIYIVTRSSKHAAHCLRRRRGDLGDAEVHLVRPPEGTGAHQPVQWHSGEGTFVGCALRME